MRIIGLLLIIILSIDSSLKAQSSIGFSEPDSIRAILDYQLPNWGHTSIFWDFSLNSSLSNLDDNLTTEPGNNVLFNLGPGINRFRESEKSEFSLSTQPTFRYNSSNQSQNSFEESEVSIHISIPWSIRQKRFFDQSDIFLNLSNSGMFINDWSALNVESGSNTLINNQNINRFFINEILIGLGYGRIRNVNPVIRSLQLAERYESLEDVDTPFRYSDILTASEQFSKRESYNRTFDRPLKYFWDDLNSVISPDLTVLDPFDLMYLTDTEFENIGSRIEGWEIDLSVGFIYNVFYLQAKNLLSGSEFSDLNRFFDFAPRLSYRWFRNFSLKHQVGVQMNYIYRTSLYKSSSNFFTPNHLINSAIIWTYNITDRILTQTSLSYQYIGRDLTQNHSLSHSFVARTELNYFVENRVSLFANSNLSFVQFEALATSNEVGRRFSLNAGIRYYMKRDFY